MDDDAGLYTHSLPPPLPAKYGIQSSIPKASHHVHVSSINAFIYYLSGGGFRLHMGVTLYQYDIYLMNNKKKVSTKKQILYKNFQ